MNQSTSPTAPGDLKELALLILMRDGFLPADGREGAIIACSGQAWRYQGGHLDEVPWQVYQTALTSSDRDNWPPYTIDFTVAALPACQLLELNVTTVYNQGICEQSRGGNESHWTVQRVEGSWQTARLTYLMSWD